MHGDGGSEPASEPVGRRVCREFGLTPASGRLAWAVAADRADELSDPVAAAVMRDDPNDWLVESAAKWLGVGSGRGDGSGQGDPNCDGDGSGLGMGHADGEGFGVGDGSGRGYDGEGSGSGRGRGYGHVGGAGSGFGYGSAEWDG